MHIFELTFERKLQRVADRRDIIDKVLKDLLARASDEIMSWTSEEVQTLITEYEQRPCLWNAFLDDYKDRVKKRDAMTQLASVLNKDKDEVEKKIHALRVQFSEELRKLEKEDSGSEVYEIPKSQWPYFDALYFIRAGTKKRKGVSNMQDMAHLPSHAPQSFISCAPQGSTSNATNKKKKITFDQNSHELIPEKASDIMSSPTGDEYDVLGTYIASEFRALKSDAVKKRLKRDILGALIRASEEDEAADFTTYS